MSLVGEFCADQSLWRPIVRSSMHGPIRRSPFAFIRSTFWSTSEGTSPFYHLSDSCVNLHLSPDLYSSIVMDK